MIRLISASAILGVGAAVAGAYLLWPTLWPPHPSAAAPGSPAPGSAVVSAQTTSDGQAPAISVSGQGRVLITPDLARVTIGVEVRDPALATAQGETARRMQAMLDGLKQSGVAEQDIQTVQYLVQPVTRHDERTRQTVSDGYVVRHLVRVTFRDITTLGQRLDSLVQGGATTIHGIQFDVADPAAAVRQAREQAVADARARADHLAALAGVTVGRPLSISEGSGPVTPQPARVAPAAESAAPTQIEAGQTEVQMTVHIRYAIQ